jgi:ribonuclease HI
MSTIYINTDGGSRGNPGPAAIGIVFFDQSENLVFKCGRKIGKATNNVAEYRAIIEALKILQKSHWYQKNQSKGEVYCRLDSELVVNQITGKFKVKNVNLLPIYREVVTLTGQLKVKIFFNHILRGENSLADKMVNRALDNKLTEGEKS